MSYKELLATPGMADQLRFPRNPIAIWDRAREFGVISTKPLGMT